MYLVPFGTGGTYEQEVEIHLHPPKSPDAEAKVWELQVVAHSKAHERTATSAPLALAIKPYVETTTKVRPERAKGRRRDAAENIKQRATFACAASLRLRFRRRLRR